jgi:hypothetical protein
MRELFGELLAKDWIERCEEVDRRLYTFATILKIRVPALNPVQKRS